MCKNGVIGLYFFNLKDVNVTMLIQMRLLLFSCPVVSNSLPPCGLRYARPPVPHHLPSLPKFMFIESVIPSSHLIPRMFSSSPLNLSQFQGLFQFTPFVRQSSLEQDTRASASRISPWGEYSGLISLISPHTVFLYF